MGLKVTGKPATLPKVAAEKSVATETVKKTTTWTATGSQRAHTQSTAQLDFRAARDIITRDPKSMATQDPALFQNRAFMKNLLGESGRLLERSPVEVQGDRELVEVAVRNDPNAIQFASGALKADKDLGMLAVKGDGYSVTMLDPALQSDRDIALQAMKTSPWCLQYLPDAMRSDREIVRTAALGAYDALKDTKNGALYEDLPLMRELAQANPLTLDILKPRSPATYAQLVNESPELAEQNAALHARLDQAGITTPGRLGSLETLKTVLDNRENPDRVDGRPLAVMTFAESDHNGAMYHERFGEVSKHYRLLYYEVGLDRTLFSSVREGTRAQPASLLVIAGHGTEEATTLSLGIGEKTTLDLGDRAKLDEAALGPGILPGAHIVLKSCDTGGGKGETPNVANLLAAAFPHANVYAPTISTNNWLNVDESGFKGPGYLGGEAYTYHVKPREEAAPMVSAGR